MAAPAGKKNQGKKPGTEISLFQKLEPFYPFLLFFLSIFAGFSLFSYDDGDYGTANNLFGRLGYLFSYLCFYFFGRASYFISFLSALSGLIIFQKRQADIRKLAAAGLVVMTALSVFFYVFDTNIISLKDGGGKIGFMLSSFLEFLVGRSGRILIAAALLIFGGLLILKESPKEINKEYWKVVFAKNREKIFRWLKPDETIPPKPEEAEEFKKEIPWVEKRALSGKYPVITDAEESEKKESKSPIFDFRPIWKTKKGKEDEFSTVATVTVPKTKESDSISPKISIFDDFGKEEPISIPFAETKGSLLEKIHNSPFSEEDTGSMEAVALTDENWEEKKLEGDSPDLITQEELQELYNFNDGETSDAEIQSDNFFDQLIEAEEENISSEDIYSSEPGEEENTAYLSVPVEKAEQPKLPFIRTTIPEVAPLRRAQYKISQKLFTSHQNSKPNPMFKMEAEYVSMKIQQIIKEYGYESKMEGWEKGPIITRYELTPPPGVKLGRITSLADELKLYLAVKSIRIVAPIPGKSTIGIEVPNKYRENVYLGDIIGQKSIEENNPKDLTIAIGKDSISGEIVKIDLNKMPHLLVAGTTGSGKSVCMNSMISYLIFTKSPDEVRFVMIDPKMVELALYENVPHLLMPVITDPRKATKALAWAVMEMEARYSTISDLKCRDIRAYNEKVNSQVLSKYKKMPYLVIFIDELSDLMMVSGKELEDYITRISQKSRAVGIHLVMATQRPSVDVITGLIKANCPARIAFHVAQKSDSKIILDYMGADALLGRGDFLYKSPSAPDLQRIQAPYISEEEIEKVVAESMTFFRPSYVDVNLEIEDTKEEFADADEESMDEAWNIIRMERKASASYLQRRMRIGYNKAARLIEMLEDKGYIGPQIGSKPREILR